MTRERAIENKVYGKKVNNGPVTVTVTVLDLFLIRVAEVLEPGS